MADMLKPLRRSAILAVVAAFVGLVAALGAASGSASDAPRVPSGALRIDSVGAMWSTDPAVAYLTSAWELEYATCAKLVNYPDAPLPEGSLLRPEIAVAMPTISQDGRTYTFQIRNDYAFSPPASGVVTAQSMKYTFERTLHPNMPSPAIRFYDNIVGAAEYHNGQASEITGIVAQGNTLRFTLLQPQWEFLTLLSLPFTCAVPTTLPPVEQFGPIPSAGPYYVSQWQQPSTIVASRNPNYTGSRPRWFDSIEYTFNLTEQEIIQRVESGISDYTTSVPAAEVQRLYDQYGPESPAAGRGLQQFFVDPQNCVGYLPLNTERPLFSEVNMRKAVNYAVDRTAYVAQVGPYAGTPHDQYLPPGVPSYEDIDAYPMHPDLDRARDLAGWHPGDPLRPITVYYRTGTINVAQYQVVKGNLEQIGFDVTGVPFAGGAIYTAIGTRGEPFDLAVSVGWCGDLNDPWYYLMLLDGTTIHDGGGNLNFAYFNDPTINERLHAARQLIGEERYAAFREIEHDLVLNYAPWASMRLYNDRAFFSRRIGGHLHRLESSGVDLARLNVRPEITVGDVQVTEPVSGTVTATFTVRLSSEMENAVTVNYATADGTAQGGADYTATSGTLSFAAHERSKVVNVLVNADSVNEPAETFFLNLSNESSGTLVDRQGVSTIADGTPPPQPQPPPPPPQPLPPPPPPPPPGPPPPPPPKVRCRVPNVIGLRLPTARSRIKRAHCSVGRVRTTRTTRARAVGRVLKQQPRPRTLLRRGGKVNLVVGRR
jgi:peptide/nickel transport system substrate-binding protein